MQRPTILQVQLQKGLENRRKEAALWAESSIDDISVASNENIIIPTKLSSIHWAAGKYKHNCTQLPSGGIADILSLISDVDKQDSNASQLM